MTADPIVRHGLCARCQAPIAPGPLWRRSADIREQARRHEGRGLCHRCYQAVKDSGALPDYERRTHTRDELLDEWETLRMDGYTVPQAARRIGTTPAALWKALQRAKADGDPRAKFNYTGAGAARRGEVA